MPVPDRVAAEAGADLPLLDDLERDRQRAGLERERQVLRLLQALAAQRDLPVPADPALDDRRAALHPAVEQDGHVVADVPAGLLAELAAAGAVELEGDDGPVGERVELGLGVLQVAAGDDAAGRPARRGSGTGCTPTLVGADDQRSATPRGQLPGHRRQVDQAVHPGEGGLGHGVLAGRAAAAPAGSGRSARRRTGVVSRRRCRAPPASLAAVGGLRSCRPVAPASGRPWPSRRPGAAPPRTACRRCRCRP